ncbi:MAG: hypothetical protein J5695_07915 [Bacteroidales bacterium]|nr:hypothetical protein [Bacteroidales bacterium]
MKLLRLLLAASLLATAASCSAPDNPVAGPIGNPYMPLWEHVPDGEPRLFEDPDAPGKYRVYVTGSHDTRFDSYCGQDDRQWSAPVEDLSAWRDEGPVFSYRHNGFSSTMYAPDLVEVNRRDDGTRKYYLFPHSLMFYPMVCVGDRPDGPFEPLNVKDGQTLPGSFVGFDPGALIEEVDDPADPDYGIGFRAYVACGIIKSFGSELDQATMYSPRRGTPDWPFLIPSQVELMLKDAREDELTEQQKQFCEWGGITSEDKIEFQAVAEGADLESFSFFEASSFRKVGNKYVYIYSGHSGPEYGLPSDNANLRYAYADSPRGPWKPGGVLVDARGIVLSWDGSCLMESFGHNNTHGSLLEINGQWYVFYHRAPRGFGYARQAMVAPVSVEVSDIPVSEGGTVRITAYDPYKGAFTVKAANGCEYTGAEVTSEGFWIYGLPPYRYYSAGYACLLSDPGSLKDSWDVWDNRMDVAGLHNGDFLGFKYFALGGLKKAPKGLRAFSGLKKESQFNIFLASHTAREFWVSVWLDGPWEGGAYNGTCIANIRIPPRASSEITRYSVPVDVPDWALEGKHALFITVGGPLDQEICDIAGFGFSRKGETMEFPQPPTVKMYAAGAALEMPSHPIWTTDRNGLTDCTNYEVLLPEGVGFEDVTVETDPAVSVESDAAARAIRCTWNGKTKTYLIK